MFEWYSTKHNILDQTSQFGCHGKKKKNSSEAIRGKKLKLCRIVYISLYENIFLLPLLKYFGCYGNFKFR